uniref:FZ domain-containing protein n=1 Tax=Astyanax mexicanus TaxID=7994 RepID=A0A8B9H3B4_ASTMX
LGSDCGSASARSLACASATRTDGFGLMTPRTRTRTRARRLSPRPLPRPRPRTMPPSPEVEVLLREWAWLIRSGCHHSTEWFFCLLVVPHCGPPGLPPQLPCRSFCELLIDSCWTALGGGGRLPVECSSLPEESDNGYQCLSVSTQKEMHFEPAATCLPVLVLFTCAEAFLFVCLFVRAPQVLLGGWCNWVLCIVCAQLIHSIHTTPNTLHVCGVKMHDLFGVLLTPFA